MLKQTAQERSENKTVKYPSLARVFSVALAVVAVILLAVGGFGLKDAAADNKENTRVYELLVSRTSELKEKKALLAAEDDSDELEGELERLKTAHEKDKSLHLVSLGTYTATKSALAQADETILQQIGTMIPGLEINEYTLETFTGLAPLLVWIYPELQDAANNLQVTVGSYKQATSQLRSSVDSAATSVSMSESELKALAEKYGISAENEELMMQILNSAVSSGQYAAAEIDAASDTALNYAKRLVALVDSLDSTVYTIDQYIPQLVQLLDSRAGLSDTKTDLVNSKTRLDKEQTEIAELQTRVDELQDCKKRISSLSVLLKTNPQIKAKTDKGGDLETAAEAECIRMAQSNKQYYTLSLVTCALLLLSGAAGIAEVPAAYEKTKSRVLLLLPVIVFLVCTAGAELVTELNKGERQYAAIAAFVIGLIHLLIILPRDKMPELDDEEE